jgi:aspartyl-tRNA(Asn)/glutamyl-tRNA(Gln) amidotransferase subunit C
MSIEITPSLVAKIASLSRLELSADELAEMNGHFEKVLKFVESLDRLDTDGVDPSVFALDVINVMGPDQKRPSLPVDEALRNGPETGDGFFLVPRIISEAGESA